MIEVRFHGRAGQGIVTAANLLAIAAGKEGKFSKAFPVFGSEKRGPPLASFCRIDDKPILLYEQIYQPDVVVVTDPSVLASVPVEEGLKEGGLVLVNTRKPVEQLGLKAKRIVTVDGTAIANQFLGRPIVNTIMVGALAAATGIVKTESIGAALAEIFKPEIAEKNYSAIRACGDKLCAVPAK